MVGTCFGWYQWLWWRRWCPDVRYGSDHASGALNGQVILIAITVEYFRSWQSLGGKRRENSSFQRVERDEYHDDDAVRSGIPSALFSLHASVITWRDASVLLPENTSENYPLMMADCSSPADCPSTWQIMILMMMMMMMMMMMITFTKVFPVHI